MVKEHGHEDAADQPGAGKPNHHDYGAVELSDECAAESVMVSRGCVGAGSVLQADGGGRGEPFALLGGGAVGGAQHSEDPLRVAGHDRGQAVRHRHC